MSKYRNSYSSYNSSYSKPALQDEEDKEPETKTGVVVNCELLNVRTHSSKTTDSGVITVLEKGDRVVILEMVGDWYKIKTRNDEFGYVGYVMQKYIQVNEV